MQNGFYESFNGRMRDELLNKSQFFGLDHARDVAGVWADVFNKGGRIPRLANEHPRPTPPRSPQQALGCATQASFAAACCSHRAARRINRRGSNRRWLKVRWQVTSASSARRSTDIRRASALFVGRLATQHTARRNSTA
jgi:hypothetical protein